MKLPKRKKIPRALLILLFTIGASLLLGFLSFTGFYVLFPLLIFSAVFFALSVIYESEILHKNISSFFNKALKRNYLSEFIGKTFLKENFPYYLLDKSECPPFFKEYAATLKELHEVQAELKAHNDEKSFKVILKKKKQLLKKRLKYQERWFSEQLFLTALPDDASEYQKNLFNFIGDEQRAELLKERRKKRLQYIFAGVFAVVAGAFMALSTTYLLMEGFATIPFIVAILPPPIWPFVIIPLAIIAGIAYGLLTFNTVTDMINNDTFRRWFQNLKSDFSKGLTVKNVIMGISVSLLVVLAVVLTVCTAGTWWTIAQKAQPVLSIMSKIPMFVMGIINPIIIGSASLMFNIENTSHTLEHLRQKLSELGKGFFSKLFASIKTWWLYIYETENPLQMLNPFRLLVTLIYGPLKLCLFIAHVVSIGFTSDQVPNMPVWLSAILSAISEFAEDFEYFLSHGEEDCHDHAGHDHHLELPADPNALSKKLINSRLTEEGGHNHGNDIPSKILRFMFVPLFFLWAAWDVGASQLNSSKHFVDNLDMTLPPEKSKKSSLRRPLSFKEAWNKSYHGKKISVEPTHHHHHHHHHKHNHLENEPGILSEPTAVRELPASQYTVSDSWVEIQASMMLEKLKGKGSSDDKRKIDGLKDRIKNDHEIKNIIYIEATLFANPKIRGKMEVISELCHPGLEA